MTMYEDDGLATDEMDQVHGLDRATRAAQASECVLGPHLPGWPLVTYTGSHEANHGPAVVRETFNYQCKDGHWEFRLTLETDNPLWGSLEERVLTRVRLSSIVPVAASYVNRTKVEP